MCDNISYRTEIQAANHFISTLSTSQTEIRTLMQQSNCCSPLKQKKLNFKYLKAVKQQKYHLPIMKSKKPNYFLKEKPGKEFSLRKYKKKQTKTHER